MTAPVILPQLRWRASPNVSARRQPVRLVVVHRPVGGYAGSIAALCDTNRPPAARVSAHVIIREDGREATQLVPWERKAWACEAFNSASDNIECPDHVWLEPLTAEREWVLRVCARVVAFRLHKRGLPARWITGDQLLSSPGFTRHYDLGLAGGGHTDPTTDRPRWHLFCSLVAAELHRGGFRASWGR